MSFIIWTFILRNKYTGTRPKQYVLVKLLCTHIGPKGIQTNLWTYVLYTYQIKYMWKDWLWWKFQPILDNSTNWQTDWLVNRQSFGRVFSFLLIWVQFLLNLALGQESREQEIVWHGKSMVSALRKPILEFAFSVDTLDFSCHHQTEICRGPSFCFALVQCHKNCLLVAQLHFP